MFGMEEVEEGFEMVGIEEVEEGIDGGEIGVVMEFYEWVGRLVETEGKEV